MKKTPTKSREGRGEINTTAEKVATELRHIGTYNAVLRNQLGSVVSETEKAAFDIASRLQSIDGLVTELIDFVHTTTRESNELLANSEARIKHNRKLILTINRYISSRIATIEASQQRIEQVTRDIQSLDSQIHQMRNVSSEAHQGFQAISRLVASLLQDNLSSEQIAAEKSALQKLATQLEKLDKGYKEVTTQEAQVIAQIHASSQQLTDMLMNALASVQFQDAARQQIEQVVNALDHLDQHANILAERLNQTDDPNCEFQSLTLRLDQMYDSYVMSSQRDSHQKAMGKDNGNNGIAGGNCNDAASPKVELF